MLIKRSHVLRSISLLFILINFSLLSCKKEKDDLSQLPPVADHWKVGKVFFDEKRWVEVVVGNMPLIITVPHGGALKPTDVPDRTCPGITTGTDSYTVELARAIEKEFLDNYQVRPYIIFTHLARIKIDQNREIPEATCGNKELEKTWHSFHNYIDTALNTAVEKYGSAMIIDLHGHGHPNQRLEIGYSLTISDLGKVYSSVELDELSRKSSLNNLFIMQPSLDFRDLLIGDQAFGTLMESQGIKSVPSKQDPYPFATESFFNGGYITRYFTSADYPKVYGWQIEANNQGIRNNVANRVKFARAFAKSITTFIKQTNL